MLACISLLVTILVPVVIKNIEDDKYLRARSDIKEIQAAMAQFRTDVGDWPTRNDSGIQNRIAVLYSSGDDDSAVIPPGAYYPVDESRCDLLADHLIHNHQGYPSWTGRAGWNGQYLKSDLLDPWGNSYLVYTAGFWLEGSDPDTDFTEAWILSAGPDGNMQTFASDEIIAPESDDIGVRLK